MSVPGEEAPVTFPRARSSPGWTAPVTAGRPSAACVDSEPSAMEKGWGSPMKYL